MKKMFIIFLLLCSSCLAMAPNEFKNLSEKEMLQYLIQRENETYECKSNCNSEFEKFYLELRRLIPVLYKTENWGMIEIEPFYFIMNPEPKFLYYQYNDWTGISISNKYLYQRYKFKLNKEWKDYLKLFSDDKYMLWTYKHVFTDKEKQNQINKCNRFLNKYPNFPLNQKIKEIIEDIDTYEDQ